MRRAWMLVLVGCGGGGDCEPLADGRYQADGSALGMGMDVGVTMDEGACTFAFVDWAHEMSDLPSGGSIAGTRAMLTGTAEWETCVGELADDGSVDFTCGDGGSLVLTPL